ncbi:MAG: ACT domain-containing protein [Coriobacteriia bacterium]|nr:ACT domain-containing protein [Coriobacteriia bacterium]
MIEQVSVFLENKPGHLAELTRALANAGINLRALMLADTSQFGVARIICDHPHAAKAVLDSAGFGVSITQVLAVEIPDTPGGIADVLDVLGRAGVNVEYAYAFVEPGQNAAVDIFKVDDPAATEALTVAGINVIAPDRLYAVDTVA